MLLRCVYEEPKGTKGVIIIRKWEKNRKHNDQKKSTKGQTHILYLATGTIPVSNDFPRGLYLWHRFSRVFFIYFCQD
jgi:hypothetical protein